MNDSTTRDLTEPDRQLLTEAYQRAKERHERRNELLMGLEGLVVVQWQGTWVFSINDFDIPDMTAADLRIIADELDRRNNLDKPKSSAHTPDNSAKD